MVGMTVAILGLALLLYCCANITREKTEKAVRKQYQQWQE